MYKFTINYSWGHMKSLLLLAVIGSVYGSENAHLQRIARERNVTKAVIQERIELMNVQIKDIERCHAENTCKYLFMYEHGRLQMDRDALKKALDVINEE